MTVTRKMWVPRTPDLTQEEASVLSLEVNPSKEMTSSRLKSLVESKLERLMDQEDDQESVLGILGVVPDLYLAAMNLETNQERAAAMMEETSLAQLVSRVGLDLEEPNQKAYPWELEVIRDHKTQSLSSLVANLARSLE